MVALKIHRYQSQDKRWFERQCPLRTMTGEHMGGSVGKQPLAQVMILESWDRAPPGSGSLLSSLLLLLPPLAHVLPNYFSLK